MVPYWRNYRLFCVFLLFLLYINVSHISAFACSADAVACASGNECIPDNFVCDDEPDCKDKSDEINCKSKTCLDTQYKCGDGRCIKNEWKCNNYADCKDGSDERSCNSSTCSTDQYPCHNGFCISGVFRCDGLQDCLLGEDEKNCPSNATCSSGLFQCKNGGCVDQTLLCDSGDDCGDNSDEENCGKTCKPGSFTCKSGDCIAENLKCNGKNDCTDSSDEDQCPARASGPKCMDDEFTCASGTEICTFKSNVCDGDNDCGDGSDEQNCKNITCQSSSFALCDNNKMCIMKYKFCDGKDDCDDGSDEKDERCNKQPSTTPTAIPTTVPTTQATCKDGEYKCKNVAKCIEKNKVCDQKQDCPNNDDESSCTNINECQRNNGNCSQMCTDTNSSFYCSCKHGYKLLNDSKTCQDINECKVLGICSQTCSNIDGSYKCSCIKGYMLTPDGKRCLPSGGAVSLLVAVGMDIRRVSTDGLNLKCVVGKITKNAVSVAVHHKYNKIFWADSFLGKIFSATMGVDEKNAQVLAICPSPKGLSVDWVNEKLYWISRSSKGSMINVAQLDGSHHKVLNTPISEETYNIVVDPVGGYMYWSNPGRTPTISRAHMDGQNIEHIITTNLQSPAGLTIDFVNKKLFWVDSKINSLECSELDGSNRRNVITHGIRHPFAIAVFAEKVYWSEPMSKTVTSANKFTGKNRTILIRHENITSYVPKGISIEHPLSQPNVTNRCVNGGCSHLCLLIPKSYSCTCPGNGVLLPDGKTCKMPVPSTTLKPSSKQSSKPASTPTKGPRIPSTNPTVHSPSDNPTGRDSTIDPVIANGANQKENRPKESNSHIIAGVVGGVVFVLLISIVVFVLCRRRSNSRKMEVVHYSSELGNVKISADAARNPAVQGKKDVDRDSYETFTNKNFQELEDDEDEDIDNIGEKQPVFKVQETGQLVGEMV